jgi:hypothetical protein
LSTLSGLAQDLTPQNNPPNAFGDNAKIVVTAITPSSSSPVLCHSFSTKASARCSCHSAISGRQSVYWRRHSSTENNGWFRGELYALTGGFVTGDPSSAMKMSLDATDTAVFHLKTPLGLYSFSTYLALSSASVKNRFGCCQPSSAGKCKAGIDRHPTKHWPISCLILAQYEHGHLEVDSR